MGDYYLSVPMMIAHRGIKINSPENTISAYREAIKIGFKAIEIDVISTKDGTVVCSHNHDLERETNGVGWLHQISAVEIEQIETGVFSHPENRKNIPTLLDVVRSIPDNIRLNIEIKFNKVFDFSTAIALARMIKTKEIPHKILVSSFNPFIVLYVRWMIPHVRTGYLVRTPDMIKWTHVVHPDCFHPQPDLLTTDVLKMCKRKNLPINVWTVNSLPAIKYCKDSMFQAVITDNPSAISL
jgi:glycerophosphoryl diester phosphodiesterase